MFDNPEKLLIILVIALLIFGPSKLAGLGGTIGRTMREFRSAVRGAQETFTSEMEQTASSMDASPDPAPNPMALPSPTAAPDTLHTASAPWEPAAEASHPAVASHPRESEFDGPSSLASEPTADALRKSLNPKG